MNKAVYGLLSICLMLGAPAASAAGKKVPQYVGAAGCKSCHKKELIGNQYGAWLDEKHSEAFETLESSEARKIAEERGLAAPAHESAECLKCHATSFGLETAQIKKKPLQHKDGVQCESCHGPGSLYKKKKTMSDHDKATAAGLRDPGNDQKICTACHNADSPTWDDDGFDFEEAKEEIAHPIPEEVKGKYIQIVKERKARGENVDDDDEDDEDDEDE
jgi:hypothetical protein